MRAHMAGGLSIIFERDHCAHMTHIRGHLEETVHCPDLGCQRPLPQMHEEQDAREGYSGLPWTQDPYQVTSTTVGEAAAEEEEDPEA